MTTLLATERIKLFTTRSPWFCLIGAIGLTVGFAAMIGLAADRADQMGLEQTQFGFQFGLMVVMVMAVLAVTTEYRFSTIRTTFQAVPNRSAVLLAKTAVVAGLALLIGEIAAFGSVGVASLVVPDADLSLSTAADWRMVAGQGLVCAVASIIAISVGILVRHSAGAISIVLIWPMLVENLVSLIPGVGRDIQYWMPFSMAQQFQIGPYGDPPLGPWAALAYFAGVAAVLLVAALAAARSRDA